MTARARRAAYAGLCALALLAVPLVVAMARADAPRDAAVVGAGATALALALLASLEGRHGREALRTTLAVLAALGTAPLGWFFGPNAGFAAGVSLLVLLTGILSRAESDRRSALVYATLAGGQLVVLWLVLAGVLRDTSLVPVIVAGHPLWHHLVAHLATQGVHLAAFVAGRALRTRYAEIRDGIARTVGEARTKRVLVEEAREDYRRVLRAIHRREPEHTASLEQAAQHADAPTLGVVATGPSERRPAPSTSTQRARAIWLDAYRTRMTGQHRAVLALSVSGALILLAIGRDPVARIVGLACIAAIAALTMVQRELARRRDDESSYGPWAVAAALSAGPAYAFGLHSAFSCVIAALLFVGGAFRAAPGAARVGRRLPVLLGVSVAHAALFAGIASGRVPDHGNVAVLALGHAPFEPFVLHALLQATYLAAFLGGWAIDARFEAVAREASLARAMLEGSEAELSRADRDLARALEETGEGLFSGEKLGRYALGRRLASGAMGDVYEASRDDGAKVAVKLVRRDRVEDPVALALLAREARALSRVSSPNVARIYEAGVDRDVPYVAMELILGESLASVLRTRGRLEADALRALVGDLCRGVRDIHDAGLVHRDLKPHNVVRSGEGSWKIVDFGLALVGADGREIGGGTAGYVAPEQALGERVDTRADLYSLGLVVYRALTGRPAFVGSDPEQIALRARQSGPPDPRRDVEVSRALELVLRITLAARPSERFATARELGAALEAALDGQISDTHRRRGEQLLAASPWQDGGER